MASVAKDSKDGLDGEVKDEDDDEEEKIFQFKVILLGTCHAVYPIRILTTNSHFPGTRILA